MKKKVTSLVLSLILSLLAGLVSSMISQRAVISGLHHEDSWLVELQGFQVLEETEETLPQEFGW